MHPFKINYKSHWSNLGDDFILNFFMVKIILRIMYTCISMQILFTILTSMPDLVFFDDDMFFYWRIFYTELQQKIGVHIFYTFWNFYLISKKWGQESLLWCVLFSKKGYSNLLQFINSNGDLSWNVNHWPTFLGGFCFR